MKAPTAGNTPWPGQDKPPNQTGIARSMRSPYARLRSGHRQMSTSACKSTWPTASQQTWAHGRGCDVQPSGDTGSARCLGMKRGTSLARGARTNVIKSNGIRPELLSFTMASGHPSIDGQHSSTRVRAETSDRACYILFTMAANCLARPIPLLRRFAGFYRRAAPPVPPWRQTASQTTTCLSSSVRAVVFWLRTWNVHPMLV